VQQGALTLPHAGLSRNKEVATRRAEEPSSEMKKLASTAAPMLMCTTQAGGWSGGNLQLSSSRDTDPRAQNVTAGPQIRKSSVAVTSSVSPQLVVATNLSLMHVSSSDPKHGSTIPVVPQDHNRNRVLNARVESISSSYSHTLPRVLLQVVDETRYKRHSST
jgi:hypothetical protein